MYTYINDKAHLQDGPIKGTIVAYGTNPFPYNWTV